MEYLTFTYNIIIIILFTAAATGFLIVYFSRSEIHYLWLTALCVLFILDTAIIYMTEIFENFSEFYDIHIMTSATLKTLVSISIVFCTLQVMKGIFDRMIDLTDRILFIFYVLFLFLLPLMETTRLHLWMYFTATQLIFIYLAVRGCRAAAKSDNKFTPEQQKWMKRFFFICIGWNVAIVVEDTIVIFFYDYISTIYAQIQQRNRCEDFERVYYVLVGLFAIFKILAPVHKTAEETAVTTEPAVPRIDLTAFFTQYELTKREREVLELLYQGKTNQEISDALFITMGTVKIHIHNIYQKCGVERRSQMMNLMQSIQN